MTAQQDEFAIRLQEACGVKRTRNVDLDREATERALEARNLVGLHGTTPIWPHPDLAEIRTRLGSGWEQIGALELAAWNYWWADPIGAAVNGLMNSPNHRPWLVNPDYTYWGIGVDTEVPPKDQWRASWSTAAYETRWYFTVWLSTGIPKPKVVEPILNPGLCPTSFKLRTPRQGWVVINGGATSGTNVRLSPKLAADQVDFSTGPTGPIKALYLGQVQGDEFAGSTNWSVLWLPDRGGFRYVHSLLHGPLVPIS